MVASKKDKKCYSLSVYHRYHISSADIAFWIAIKKKTLSHVELLEDVLKNVKIPISLNYPCFSLGVFESFIERNTNNF